MAVRIRVLSPDRRTPAARDVLASVLRYILETDPVDPATLRALLARQVGRREAAQMLTAAEKLRQEGKIEGKREALLLLLRERFGRLPAAVTATIDNAGGAELDVWFRRGLTVASLEDVLELDAATPPNTPMQPTRAQRRGARRRARG